MKIINREQFLKMPEGTLYIKYKRCYFYHELSIKHESTNYNDWYYTELTGDFEFNDESDFSEKLDQWLLTGESFRFSLDISQRDGQFDEEEFFAIYEKEDIQMLINKLQGLLDEK